MNFRGPNRELACSLARGLAKGIGVHRFGVNRFGVNRFGVNRHPSASADQLSSATLAELRLCQRVLSASALPPEPSLPCLELESKLLELDVALTESSRSFR